ncbi:MAG TPA: hypothetical protein VL769_10625 [Acidimicrobiia bacterium]|jgi:hypothetical protein|nr:hypothetical protein [Acidimicrobiia bacterium]
MVRFSDMLGGSSEGDDAAAADSPYAALASDAAEADDEAEPEADAGDDAFREPVPVATFETPEAVLDRLTQYRTSTRAADPVAPPTPAVEEPAAVEAPAEATVEAEPETAAEPGSEPLPPVGDDFLPNARGIVRRSGRGRKRHP